MLKRYMAVALMLLSGSVMAGDWISDPVVSESGCLNVSGKEVVGFITKYYLPSLVFSSNSKQAEKDLFQSYVISSTLLTRSQICLAEALEIKGVTDDLKKQQKILTSGTSFGDKKELKAHRKLSEKVDKKISKALAKDKKLKPEQRKVFTVGTTIYAGATYSFVELNKAYAKYFDNSVDDAQGLLDSASKDPLGAASGMFGKVTTVALLGKGISVLWPMTVNTGNDILNYSKKNDIELDNDVASKVGW